MDYTVRAAAVEGCRFEFDGPVIRVFGPGPGREAGIAAGRSVFRLRVAVAGLGLAGRYGVALKSDQPDLLARVVVESTGQVDPVLAQSPPERMDLREAALVEGVRLTWLADDPMVVVLSTEGDTAVEAVAAGCALERVLWAASAYGLSPAFCDRPPDGLLDTGRAQVMIWLAYQTLRSAPVPWSCSSSTVGSAV